MTETNDNNLEVVKNSLGIVDGSFDNELNGYLNASKSYIASTLSADKIAELKDDVRYTVAIQQLTLYLWQNRGDATAPRDALPFTIQTLINNLNYN